MLLNLSKDTGEIKEQTTRTNGRVSSLEKWRYMMTGGLIFINIVLVPIFILYSIKLFR